MEFQIVPGTEAPAEMTIHFPQFKTLDTAELAAPFNHNILTPRGALVRDASAWSKAIGEAIERSGDRSLVYPHAQEVLRDLKNRGACLLLLTNGFREYQLPMTRAFGMEPYFDVIMAADDLGTVKPFSEAFERTFRTCAHAPHVRRYHVGDTLSHDVLGARDSGIFAVWIEWNLPEDLDRLGLWERLRSDRLAPVEGASTGVIVHRSAAPHVVGPENRLVRPKAPPVTQVAQHAHCPVEPAVHA
jgi:HAD superfamily hydrolase (TIGR01549 family)